jgi:hypothetical protein
VTVWPSSFQPPVSLQGPCLVDETRVIKAFEVLFCCVYLWLKFEAAVTFSSADLIEPWPLHRSGPFH